MPYGTRYGAVLLDTIQQIGLESGDSDLLNSIISSITPNDVELQPSQVETLAVHNQSGGQSMVDLSSFFLRHRLAALRHLSVGDVPNIDMGVVGIANNEADHTLTQHRGDFVRPNHISITFGPFLQS